MICPKCGFEQPDGATDCARCGIVFSRYRPDHPPNPPIAPPGGELAAGPIEPGPPPFTAAPAETLYAGPLPPAHLPPPPPRQTMSFSPYLTGYRFEIGAIFGETFRTYFANFLPFVVLSLLAYSPLLAWTLFTATAQQTATKQFNLVAALVTILLSFLCGPLTTATVTFGVFQQMRGRDTSLAECLKMGLANLLPVLGVALLQGVLVGLGFVFCIVPGLLFLTMYAVSVPAAVEERPGVVGALDRSSKLTESYRWHVFGVLFLLGILGFVVGMILLGISTTVLSGSPALAQLIQQVMNAVFGGISATAAAVMYYRLRSVKESIDVDQIASVFD